MSCSGPYKIEARLGDLDLKSPAKTDYWKSIEEKLINGGWYTGDEKEFISTNDECALQFDSAK